MAPQTISISEPMDAREVFAFLQDMEEAILIVKHYAALLVDVSTGEMPSEDGFRAMGRIFDQINENAVSIHVDWSTLKASMHRQMQPRLSSVA